MLGLVKGLWMQACLEIGDNTVMAIASGYRSECRCKACKHFRILFRACPLRMGR